MDGWACRRLDSAALPLHGLNRPEVNNRFNCYGAVLLILLIGAGLRVAMLGRDVRFNVDEALYASYARRIALHGDFLLADSALDKPPLGLFLTAASFTIFGTKDIAARLPTLFVSILNMAVFLALARRVYDERTVIFAALLLALSPL
ncbi:MAG TPA: glycosyltransferase family 39 protein, partial [Aggregatilineales bacterium]|nr:glycosyltransferase family 39 protein [Aggregatilineales bacterium]